MTKEGYNYLTEPGRVELFLDRENLEYYAWREEGSSILGRLPVLGQHENVVVGVCVFKWSCFRVRDLI